MHSITGGNMAGIGERIGGGLARMATRALPALRAREAEAAAFRAAYREAGWMFNPRDLLRELDSETLAVLVDQLQYEQILTLGADTGPMTERDRMYMVRRSRYQYRWDPLVRWTIRLWTYFGYGLNVDVVPEDDDPAIKEWWNECWEASRNRLLFGQRYLRMSSDVLLRDGEVFFTAFANLLNGRVTWRRMLTDEVVEIVHDPDDRTVPLWYVRRAQTAGGKPVTLYYPDWLAEGDRLDDWWADAGQRAGLGDNAIRLDEPTEARSNTTCAVVAAQLNVEGGRGWPFMQTGLTWSSAYGRILQDRAAVVRKRARYTDRVTVDGGSRALEYVRGGLESSHVSDAGGGAVERNPMGVAGSDWLQNRAVNREPLDMGRSGAADAERDSNAIFALAALGGGLFPHYAGKGEAFRLATATAMETPIMRGFNDYQQTWADVYRDLCEHTLRVGVQYGDVAEPETYDAAVNQDALVDMDVAKVGRGAEAIGRLAQSGTLDAAQARRAAERLLTLTLQALGVSDAEDVVNPPEEGPGEGPEGEEPAGATEAAADWQAIVEAAERIVAGLEDGDGGD
jgi:hypothetical protein